MKKTETLFDFLVQEETRHHQILEDMFRFVNRPNEWVEAAEFRPARGVLESNGSTRQSPRIVQCAGFAISARNRRPMD